MARANTVSPRLTPCLEDDEARPGFHIARRNDWSDPGRFEVIALLPEEVNGHWEWHVWRCGGARPDRADQWQFQVRISGFRSGPEKMLELTATRH